MNSADHMTRDYTLCLDGSVWATGANEADMNRRLYGAAVEVSGDEIARIRADLREIGGADCD